MLFKSTSRNNEIIDINIDGDQIAPVKSVKFLGIHIDDKLNWKDELQSVENTVSSACFALRTLRYEIDMTNLKQVYYALVESKLRYSIRFWGNGFEGNINKAFVVQKRAIRTMVRISQQHSCRDYFLKLELLTVPCLFILVITTDLVKKLHGLETETERKERLMTRRKYLKIDICPRLNVVKYSPRYQAPHIYNHLPIAFREITSYRIFKSKLKSFLIKKCYYSIDEFINDKYLNEL
ncbi:hypothetical protein JYU34_008080 [Plutella xylostella]|uniref:Uncharacterized protein n=1 Tax=Plutella xylostella TaxID=51655 RepID=A0ABQ7QNQ5_PLUXY|nr:hypothetical protein JYU34_008080 [Plutella xylostella]